MPLMPDPTASPTVVIVFATLIAVSLAFSVVMFVMVQIDKRRADRIENIRRCAYRTNTAATEKDES